MRASRAFTMIELLVAIGILAVLAAIASPVLIQARESAKVQASISRLKQLHMAVTLYRQDWEGAGAGSMASSLGLPDSRHVYTTYFGLGKSFFVSPCGYKRSIEGNLMQLSYQYGIEHGKTGDESLMKYGENHLLFVDAHCNPEGTLWGAPHTLKRGLCVLLSGQTKNLFKRGWPGLPEWRTQPE